MNFPSRLVRCAALAMLSYGAWARGSLAGHPVGVNMFATESRAAASNAASATHAGQGAQQAAFGARSAFEVRHTRPLRVLDDKVEPQPSAAPAPDRPWSTNGVALRAGGSDSFGAALNSYEQREQNRRNHLHAHGLRPAGGGPLHVPGGPPDSVRGAPNPIDPSVSQPETRTFYDNGAGARCTATGSGAATSRSSCTIGW
ncbi:hypothetical protein QZM52_25860 [Burkholderia metallica]|uniref:Peptide-binding protein n=1 Tax=Burkholderia metallica TaxID=488729 RepID=A0ABT8PHU0_9BURK|nr:hypothetical protein [Burkholderia metallica]MDN7934708.1 hypothetical protein [Burkholderia metallica]